MEQEELKEPETDEEEEALKKRFRVFYKGVGKGIAVAGVVTGIIVFSIQRILVTQSLQPTMSLAVLVNAVMGAGLFLKRRWILGAICTAGAFFCLFYLKNVLVVGGQG